MAPNSHKKRANDGQATNIFQYKKNRSDVAAHSVDDEKDQHGWKTAQTQPQFPFFFLVIVFYVTLFMFFIAFRLKIRVENNTRRGTMGRFSSMLGSLKRRRAVVVIQDGNIVDCLKVLIKSQSRHKTDHSTKHSFNLPHNSQSFGISSDWQSVVGPRHSRRIESGWRSSSSSFLRHNGQQTMSVVSFFPHKVFDIKKTSTNYNYNFLRWHLYATFFLRKNFPARFWMLLESWLVDGGNLSGNLWVHGVEIWLPSLRRCTVIAVGTVTIGVKVGLWSFEASIFVYQITAPRYP